MALAAQKQNHQLPPTTTTSKILGSKNCDYNWWQKHIEQDGRLLADVKAAARVRGLNLTEEDYKQFEESLKDGNGTKEAEDNSNANLNLPKDENKCELA